MNKQDFISQVAPAYQDDEGVIQLGGAIFAGETIAEVPVNIALKSLNRHGLIAGATGTGKTKTIQLFAELLSDAGTSVMVMDMKGDLSGLAAVGQWNEKIQERLQKIKLQDTPSAFPVELCTLSEAPGVRMRTTIAEMGPMMFSKMLELSDAQTGIVSMVFKYADDNKLPLLELADFKKVLNYLSEQDPKTLGEDYSTMSSASLGVILRKCLTLEQQGGAGLFGEPSFELVDLLRTPGGKGQICVLRLADIQNRPQLFSSFMLAMLSEIYLQMPEIGDPDQPKLVLFFDEAHLIFKHANQALLDYIETVVKLIRSKGVGIIFCTQSPGDISPGVLSQLGLKVQHALRAFTAKDRKELKLVAQNYPLSEFYKTEELLTNLGIGEAAITALDKKGRPTPLIACMLRPPRSRMGVLTDAEVQTTVNNSALSRHYATRIDRESAVEILQKRQQAKAEAEAEAPEAVVKAKKGGMLATLSKNTLFRQVVRGIFRQAMYAILAALGLKSGRNRRK